MATLESVLLNTLNKEEGVRKAAERALNEACIHAGYTVSLLRVACDAHSPKEVRQAASVALKNGIKRNWTTEEEEAKALMNQNGNNQQVHNEFAGKYTIPKSDRDLVRANILTGLAMVRSDNESLRRVLAECVGSVAEWDYPERWQSFIPELVQMLSNVSDRDCVHNALLALRRVVKRFEYKRRPRKARLDAERKMKGAAKNHFPLEEENNKRDPLNLLVEHTFPLLLQYGKNFVMAEDDNSGFMLRLIGKIFYSATRLELPPHLQNMQVTQDWFKLWEMTISKPLSPLQSEGDDLDDLSLRPWWKAKKGALEIAVRVFQQCVKDPLFISDDDQVTKQFTAFFIEGGVASSLLLAATHLLEDWARLNKPLPSRILQQCLSYCSIALEPSKTYKILRPHLQFLVDSVVLKCLSFSEKDQQQWQDEPEAYACHDLDPLVDIFDAKATACSLLLDACRLRSRDVLDGVVNHLFQEMSKRASASKQDACLYAVGALAEILAPMEVINSDGERVTKKTTKRVEKYKAHLESMISKFVVPELNAPEPHVRARACWVVGRYAHVDWKDVNIAQQTFGGLLDRLGDAHLPVQSQAASSLRAVLVLDPEESLAAQALRGIAINHLPLIVEKYLIIMGKVGADDVVAGLQALIDAFHEEIAPMAAEICNALVQAYFHYANADEDEDEEGEKAAAAFETLDAINSLMDCAATSKTQDKNLITRMEPVVMPLLDSIITPDCEVVDFLDTTITTYSFLTYYAPVPLSDHVWIFVGRMYQCFKTCAFDSLQDFLVPLEHLAFREPQRFFTGTNAMCPPGMTYAQACFDMCRVIMEDIDGEHGAGEQDLRSAATLLCAILQAAPPMSNFIPIEVACKQASYWLFGQTHTDLTKSTRAKLFEIVESCFYVDPMKTRQVFGQNLLVGLQRLRDVLPQHNLIRKKKVAVLGLTSLIPVLSRENNPECMSLAIAECAELLENIEQQKAFEDGGEEDDEEDEDIEDEDGEEEEVEEEEEIDEDENYVDDEEEAFANFLKANGEFGGAWGDLDGEGEEDEEDPEDYPWPLKSIDEKEKFGEALKVSYATNATLLQASVGFLDPSIRDVIAKIVPDVRFFA